MPINAITSDDTLTLYGRVIADLADQDVSTIEYPDDLAEVKTGKNGNTIFSDNQKGNNGVLTLRVLRGSSDDQFLNTQLEAQKADFPSTVLAVGSFVKRLGDGLGNVVSDSYTLAGGIFTKQPGAKENVEGNTDQAVVLYTLKFALVQRGIK